MTLSIEQVFAKQNFFNNAEMYFEPVMNNGREFKLTLSNIYDNDIVLNAVKITEFSIPEDSPIYMEGYQMLSQTAGTMSKPIDIGRINEVRDYGLYTKDKNDGAHYGANYFITKVGSLWYLIGATSSFKTSIFFKLKDGVCQVYWDLENTIIAAGAEYQADFICVLSSRKRSDLMEEYAYLINTHHPHATIMTKTGWCSWYCYYADLSENDVIDNLEKMHTDYSMLDYVQIDDGYQLHMGDWLTDSEKFPSGLKELCAKIKAAGKKPAIWVAPFIADGKSTLFREHKDWFIKGDDGNPIAAESVTYGGWRETPWYLLDMSIHEVRVWVTKVFKILHQELGIDYFKLDACYWGAIKNLKYRNAGITAVTHYRLGLDAIRKGVGYESYILGCNAPLWPSLGLVNAQRITDDVDRTPERIKQQIEEFRHRNWMANRLWGNDVDCLITAPLPNKLDIEQKYYRLLFAMVLASGGPVVLGDNLNNVKFHLPKELFKQFIADSGSRRPAYFIDDELSIARSVMNGVTVVFSLNQTKILEDYTAEKALFRQTDVSAEDTIQKDDVEIIFS